MFANWVFSPALHTADSNYPGLLCRWKLPQMSLCALNPLFLAKQSQLSEHIFIFCWEWEVRLNPRRLAVARIDMSGSINHQMLLKDARADALRGGGLFARQVGVSKKSRYCLRCLVFFWAAAGCTAGPRSRRFLSGPRAAVPSAAGTWCRDAPRRREGGRAGGALKEDKPSKGTSCLQRAGHVFYTDADINIHAAFEALP